MPKLDHLVSAAIGGAAACAAMLIGGATSGVGGSRTIDVGRINIREPDGTLRMAISSAALEPGIIVHGHEQPHPTRRSAGMLLYNDEGTENGGLIFDGKQDADGTRHSGGSLTFDRYKQDQVVQLLGEEDGPRRHAGLIVADEPEQPMNFAAIERARTMPRDRQLAAYRAAHLGATRRVFLGRDDDGASQLVLKDASGLDRLRLRVAPDGGAAIDFLDAAGHVTRTMKGDDR